VINSVGPSGGSIASPTYTINLIVKAACNPPATITAPTIADGEAKLNGGAYSFSWDVWTTKTPVGCTLAYTATIPSAISKIVTANLTARTLAVTGTDATLAGVYSIVITATTAEGAAISTGNTATFKLTLIADATTATSSTVNRIISNVAVASTTARVARNFVRPGSSSSISDRAGRPGTRTATRFDSGLGIDTIGSSTT